MKLVAFLLAFNWALLLVAFRPQPDCPPHFEIGQTYAEIKAGPCPDIEGRARWADSLTASYVCPHNMVVVVGSKQTGKMIGFFQWNGQ